MSSIEDEVMRELVEELNKGAEVIELLVNGQWRLSDKGRAMLTAAANAKRAGQN